MGSPSSFTWTSPRSLAVNAASMSLIAPIVGPSSAIALLRKYTRPMLSCGCPLTEDDTHRFTSEWPGVSTTPEFGSHRGRVPRSKTSVCEIIANGDSSGPRNAKYGSSRNTTSESTRMTEYPPSSARCTTLHCCAHSRNMSPGFNPHRSSSVSRSVRCELCAQPSTSASRLSSSHSCADEVSMR